VTRGRRPASGFRPESAKGVTDVQFTIVPAPGADADAVRDLFLEYGESLGFNTCFAGLDQELDTLPGDYAPPRGCLLLARADGEAAGCAGVRPLGEATCEMKRLYVRPQFRRARLGWKLAEAAIARARAMGYRRMFLDTLPTMREARILYAALGFKACPPYYDNSLLGSDCFELEL
jgi:ribosomal protein S18 acetylase RimI-like enzyme